MGDSDLALPKSTMLKAIKEKLPENLKIAGDASETIIRCCDEFVQMVSSTANDISQREGRSTILPEHVIKSVEQLGFNAFLDDINAGVLSYFVCFCLCIALCPVAPPNSACWPCLFPLLRRA